MIRIPSVFMYRRLPVLSSLYSLGTVAVGTSKPVHFKLNSRVSVFLNIQLLMGMQSKLEQTVC